MSWDSRETTNVHKQTRLPRNGTTNEASGQTPSEFAASQCPAASPSPGQPAEELRQMANWVTIIQRVWSCGRHLRRWLNEQLEPWELTDSEFLLLYSCSQTCGEGLAQQDLGGVLGVSPARVSNHVEQLTRRDLIEVARPPRDRRRQLVRLTPAGGRLVEAILDRLAPQAARLEQSAAAEQRQTALRWLDGCRRAAG